MALNLRPWQESAINKCLKWFDSNQDNKFLVNAAPGAGKTICASVIALELIKKNKIERVIVIAPRKEVVKQWAEEFFSVTGRKMMKFTGEIEDDEFDICATWNSIENMLDGFQHVCNKYKTLILASFAFLIIIIFSVIALSVISKINNQKASLVFNDWSVQEIESEEGLKKSNELFEDLTTSYSRTGYAKLAILTKASSDAKNGERQNAIMGFSKLVKLTNGINGNKLYNKLARVSAARLLFANGNYDEALIMIEKYSSSSTNAYIHELTGDILMKKDSISLAKEQYQIAKEKYIDEASLSIISMKLANIDS